MKRFCTAIIFQLCFFSDPSFSQAGMWTWMNGDTLNNISVHGAAGVFDVTFHPDAYYERNHWTDKQGNLWYMAEGDSLWKYDISINQWAWIKGSGSLITYGTKAISSPFNTPGVRKLCVITWTDTIGCLWLYGGYNPSLGLLSDLWKYDPQTNEWTWVSGDTSINGPGNYGVIGIPSVNNFPAARVESNATWVDSSQNALWFYGGQIATNEATYDLWKYDVSTTEWTWMHGDTIGNTLPVYGTKKISDPGNTPGSRDSYSKWIDNNGDFWLFAGWDYVHGIYYNDTWKYEKSTNAWAWMHGINVDGFNSANCAEDSVNIPPLAYENKGCWTDKCGNFWTFYWDNLLWAFNPVTSNWILPKGTHHQTIPAHYGVKGVADTSNTPLYWSGSESWTDKDGNFWLYLATASVMWKYTPGLNCVGCTSAIPVSNFNSADTLLCPGTCADFSNLSLNGQSYAWTFTGGIPSTSNSENPGSICYNNSGSYDVQLIVANSAGTDTLLLSNYVTVYPSPPPQGIQQNGDSLIANQTAVSYQWYYNGILIPGATNYFYLAQANGNYNIVATDSNGCEVEAVINDVVAAVYLVPDGNEFMVFPNPSADIIKILANSVVDPVCISIISSLGTYIWKSTTGLDKTGITIDIQNFPAATYIIEIQYKEYISRVSLVKF
jgi:PKD repeat protein